jgi:IPT/TIG domain-containing protein
MPAMVLAWIRHKERRRCLALILLMGVCVGLEAAQQPPKYQSPPAPRLIILPPKAVAGAQVTLAVLDSRGRLLPNIAVELSGGQKVTTDVTGRALFKAADEPGILVAKIAGQGISASTTVVASEDSGPHVTSHGAPGGVNVVSYPHVLAIHDRFTLEGSGFRGAADSNHVYLNDDPCLIVASSAVSLVVLPGPRVPIGDVNLHVTVAGIDAGRFPASVVLLEFSGPAEAANAGSSGKLFLRAHGTTEPLLLEVRNGSPGVIQLSKGNVQRLKTSGGDQNIAPIEMKFVTEGNYSISARLISTDASLPDLELARRRLTEARKIASGDWPARIDQVLLKINQAPLDLPQIRAELKSMLDDKPAASLATLLDSAWRELN